MLIDKLKKDTENFIHLVSLLNTDHEILYSTEDCLLIHFDESDIFIAECDDSCVEKLIPVIKSYDPDSLETTSDAIYEALKNDYINHYKCVQYGPYTEKEADAKLTVLRENDLPFVMETYHEENYVKGLFERDRILGYYDNDELIGYIARHIDGTIGALYVSEKYRGRGLGKKIVKAATAYFKDYVLYSQVVDDNTASINMHKDLNVHMCQKKICWVYNNGFSF